MKITASSSAELFRKADVLGIAHWFVAKSYRVNGKTTYVLCEGEL